MGLSYSLGDDGAFEPLYDLVTVVFAYVKSGGRLAESVGGWVVGGTHEGGFSLTTGRVDRVTLEDRREHLSLEVTADLLDDCLHVLIGTHAVEHHARHVDAVGMGILLDS